MIFLSAVEDREWTNSLNIQLSLLWKFAVSFKAFGQFWRKFYLGCSPVLDAGAPALAALEAEVHALVVEVASLVEPPLCNG